VTMRVDRTTFIATSHFDIPALTKSHLPMIASSLEHGLGVDARYLKSPETKSGSAAKTQQ
jgi:hypothetical protein